MVIGVAVCIFGVVLIIGVDFELLFQGRLIGYLLAFGAVFSWNGYNFLTASLHDRYSSITLTCTQLICTSLLILPYAIHTMPPIEAFTPGMVGGITVSYTHLGLIDLYCVMYAGQPYRLPGFSNGEKTWNILV